MIKRSLIFITLGLLLLISPAMATLTATFTTNVTTGYNQTTVLFTSTSTNATLLNWSFGDGTWNNGTSVTVTKTYNSGTYSTLLKTWNVTDGIATSTTKTITVNPVGYTQKDLSTSPTYVLTIHVTSSTTGLVIPVVSFVTSDGQTLSTANGTTQISVLYSTVLVQLTSEGYATTARSYLVDTDREVTIQMTPYNPSSNTRQLGYSVHQVRIRALDFDGEPIENMRVDAVGVETTVGAASWINDILGINTETIPIQSTIMNGTTGDDGSVVFIMIESYKYQLNFTSIAHSINQVSYLYPQDTNYDYVFWTEPPRLSSTTISIEFWNATNQTNTDYVDLGVRYLDTGSSTNHLLYTIKDENNNEIFNTTGSLPNNLNVSYPVLKTQGVAYIMTVRANSTWFDLPVVQSKVIRIEGHPIPFDLGSEWNNWVSLVLIFGIALLISRASLKYGVAIVPCLALMFAYIGFLEISGLMIAAVVFLGVLFYLRFAEQESDM